MTAATLPSTGRPVSAATASPCRACTPCRRRWERRISSPVLTTVASMSSPTASVTFPCSSASSARSISASPLLPTSTKTVSSPIWRIRPVTTCPTSRVGRAPSRANRVAKSSCSCSSCASLIGPILSPRAVEGRSHDIEASASARSVAVGPSAGRRSQAATSGPTTKSAPSELRAENPSAHWLTIPPAGHLPKVSAPRVVSQETATPPRPGSAALEVRQPPLGPGLHAFLEVGRLARPVLLGQLALGRPFGRVGEAAPHRLACRLHRERRRLGDLRRQRRGGGAHLGQRRQHVGQAHRHRVVTAHAPARVEEQVGLLLSDQPRQGVGEAEAGM